MTGHTTEGALLRGARLIKGWTQEELGEMAHVSRGTISALEADEKVLPNNRQEILRVFYREGVVFEVTDTHKSVHFYEDRADMPPPGPPVE